MELVALSDRILRILAGSDRHLKRVFYGVFPADRLPEVKNKKRKGAFIVNTDPAGEPGQHWLGIWTEDDACEVMDSYGLPLSYYNNETLQAWFQQWKELITSDMTLQSLDSQACGDYALLFVKARSRGATFSDFLAEWYMHDQMSNDTKAVGLVREMIDKELYDDIDGKDVGQMSVSRRAFHARNDI